MFQFHTHGVSGVRTIEDSTIVSVTRQDGDTIVDLQVSYTDGTEAGGSLTVGHLDRAQAVELILALSEAIRGL